MTKSLSTLIKIHKRRLDDMRKELAILLDARDQTVKHLTNLEKEMQTEQKLASESEEGQFTYTSYLKRSIQTRERLRGILMDAEQKIRFQEERIRAEFAEQKKYEIMKDRKEREEQAEEDRREGLMLDEVGINKFLQDRKSDTSA
jgi:flagellar FliJ protein